MDNSTLRVGNIPKVTGEDAIGVDNWALVVAEWAERQALGDSSSGAATDIHRDTDRKTAV